MSTTRPRLAFSRNLVIRVFRTPLDYLNNIMLLFPLCTRVIRKARLVSGLHRVSGLHQFILGLLLLLSQSPAWAVTIDQGSSLNLVMSEDASPTAFSLSLSATKNNIFETFSGWSVTSFPVSGSVAFSSAASLSTSIFYSPASNFFGSVSFTIRAAGSSGNNFITINLTINPINDRPSFTIGASQVVVEDSGARSISGWATGFNPGNSFESAQVVTSYSAIADIPDLFSVLPAVSTSGVLTFTPAVNRSGIATVSVTVKDNGGTASGGLDTSFLQTFAITISPAADVIIFAKPTATGAGNGSSWTDAFTLRQAMDYSTSGEQIWVAHGTHKPGSNRSDKFDLKAGVSVFGGFVGTETLESQRNPRSAFTSLSGDIGTVNVTVDNSFRVVVASGSGNLDGVIIRDGNANGVAPENEGAGLFMDSASPRVSNCVFMANSGTFTGGAVSIRGTATPLFQRVIFNGNTGQYGGAVYSITGGTFENCIFQGNSASGEGGAVRTSTGGLTSFANCIFTGNTAPAANAAISIYGTTSCVNTIVWSNTPASLISSGTGTLTNCLVQGGAVTGFTNSGGLVTVDPLFSNAADPDGADNVWGTADDGLFPQSTSHTRDAGTATGAPVVDIRGVSRPRGNGFDIGCYERGVIYVRPTASAPNNGTSWTNAFVDLRAALVSATATDEVWVAAGTYSPSPSDETLSFPVAAGVGLYAGFNGSEITRDARNWTINRVTLNGILSGGNSQNILTATGNGGIIDGFIITGAVADGTYGSSASAGGGLSLVGASPTVRNCIFTGNSAGYAGGAIQCISGSSPRIENCLFVNNSAGGSQTGFGGAVKCETNSSPTIFNCTFVGNSVAGVSALGTAIETVTNSDPIVTNCIIWGNTGPSVAIVNNSPDSVPVISNCVIEGLSASFGTLIGATNSAVDPQFFAQGDPNGVDNLFFTNDDGLFLRTGSPAANTGTGGGAPPQDIKRQSRPTGTGFDMGCYEGQIGRVTFASATSGVSEGTASTNIAVSISPAADFPMTVNYAVTGGTAINGIGVSSTGTSQLTILPLYSVYNKVRSTTLYLKSDMGGVPATVRSLSLDLNSQYTGSIDTLTVRMRHTALADFSGASWGVATGWDTVFSGPLANIPAGPLTLNFNQGDNVFSYDGSNNVMVDFIIRTTTPGSFVYVAGTNFSSAQRTMYGLEFDPSSFLTPDLWQGTGDSQSPTPNLYPYLPTLRFSTTTGGGLPDYTLASGSINFAAGQVSANIPVTILPDSLDEPNETVLVALSSPVGGVLGTLNSHTLTITDDDNAPTVQFSVANSVGGEALLNPSVAVTLSSQSTQTVSVTYKRSGGTATPAGTDLNFVDGTLIFLPGEVSKIIPGSNFSVISDSFDEDDATNETVIIGLANPSFCTVGSISSHTYGIQDDDTSSITPSLSMIDVTESDLTTVQSTITVGSRPFVGTAGDAVVQVDATVQDGGEVAVSADGISFSNTASLWFHSTGLGTKNGRSAINAADWNAVVKPAFFIRSVDDFIDDGDQTTKVNIAVSGVDTTDARYLALGVQAIDVTTHDDGDSTGIVINPLQSPAVIAPPLPLIESYVTRTATAGTTSTVTFVDVSKIQIGMRAFNFATSERRFVSAIVGNDITFDVPLTSFTLGSSFAFGFENSFRVTLASEPINPVQMQFSFDNSRVSGYWNSGNTLDASNWNTTGIELVVYPQGNQVAEIDQTVGLTVSVQSTTDPTYPSATPEVSSVIVYEDDVRGVAISPVSVDVTELGASTVYEVVLTSEPQGAVTVTPSISLGAGQFVVGGALNFNASNWFNSQIVLVSAIDDFDYELPIAGTISNTVSGSDYGLASVSAPNVSVTVKDNESPNPALSPISGLVTDENKNTASFTITLAAQPASLEIITIPLSISDNTEAEFFIGSVPSSSTVVQFSRLGGGDGFSTPALWNSSVIVTVRGVDDIPADGDVPYTIVTGDTSSSFGVSSLLDGATVADVLAVNVDNESAGVRVIGGSLAVTEGISPPSTYNLQLSFKPGDISTFEFNVVQVKISTTSPDITISPATVLWFGTPGASTFTTAQSIEVRSVDDSIDEATETVLIKHEIITSTNSGVFPLALAIQDAQIDVVDNDVAGVAVSAPAVLTTSENGGTATFTTRLNTQPTGDVTIDLSLDGDVDEVFLSTAAFPASAVTKRLTFNNANWNIPQIVTVIGRDDALVDGNRSFTVVTGGTESVLDLFYGVPGGLVVLDVGGSNVDNDNVGVTVSKTTVSATESVTAPVVAGTYTIRLNSQPTGSVTVTLDGSNQVSFLVAGLPVTVVFFAPVAAGDSSGRDAANPSLWNTPIPLGVIAIDDKIQEPVPQTAMIFHTVNGADYTGVPVNSVTATIADPILVPIVAGIAVTSSVSAIPELNGIGSVNVVLTSKPTSTVVVALASSDLLTATISPASITFTPSNWDQAKSFTVTGVNDDIDQDVNGVQAGDARLASLSFVVTSFDTNYDVRAVSSISATVSDDDSALVSVAFPGSGCVVNEAGSTSTFSVVLGTKPVGTITQPLTVVDPQQYSLSMTSLIFTPTDWNIPQFVTITGLDSDNVNNTLAVNSSIETPAPSSSVAGIDAYTYITGASVLDVPVSIEASNAVPRLGSVADLIINESSSPTPVIISGIDAGQTGEIQTLSFTVVASNPALFPAISSTSTLSGGILTIPIFPAQFLSGSSLITVTVSDDSSVATDSIIRSTTVSFAITVVPVNDKPLIVVSNAVPTHIENGSSTPVLPSLTIADVDNITLTSATITIVNPLDQPFEILQAVTTGTSIVSSFDANSSTLYLNASVPQSLSDFQQVLRTVSYSTASDNPNSSVGRSIQIIVSDGTEDSAPVSSDVVIQPTNDSPVLSGLATNFSDIIENNISNLGLSIDDLIGDQVVINDPDNAQRGVAISGTTGASLGSWEFSVSNGASWATIPSLVGGDHVALRADGGGVNRLRFVPLNDNNGSVSISWRAWDATDLIADGLISTVVGAGTSPSPYSSSTLTATLTVTPVNDAPVLTAPFTGVLSDVAEDSISTQGDTVESLLVGRMTDVDVGDQQGIAVTVVDDSNGFWQYSLDGAANWFSFGSVTASNATLLAANLGQTRIRFIPTSNFNGTAHVTYGGWDVSDGNTNGQIGIDTSVNGGITDFSVLTATATVTVTPVNDAPVLSSVTPVTIATITEDLVTGAEVPVSALLSGLSFTDSDASPLFGIAVVGVDTSSGVWEYSINSGGNWSSLSGVTDATARLLTSSTTVNRVRFIPNNNFAGSVALTLRLWDRTDLPAKVDGSIGNVSLNGGTTPYSSAAIVVVVQVTAVNDAPAVDLNGSTSGVNGAATYTEGNGALLIAFPAVVSDIDSLTLTGMTISFATVDSGAESLNIDVSGTSITASGTTSLTLSGTDTVIAYQQVLRSLTFTHASSNPTAGPRTVSVVANDGTDPSNSVDLVVTVVPVNDAPTLATNPFTLSLGQTVSLESFTPEVLGGSDVETTDPTLLVFIVDLIPGQGQLLKSSVPLGIGGAFTLAEFLTPGVIQYKHTAVVGGSDGFAVRLTDPNGGSSALKTVIVTITGVSPPVVVLSGGALTVNEEDPATLIDTGVTTAVTDADTPILDGGSLTMTLSGATSGDLLVVSGVVSGPVSVGGVVIGDVSGGMGGSPLVITFTSNATATQARITTLLQGIQYRNVSNTPPAGPRTLTVVVNDGGTSSVPVTTTITVMPFDDAPVISPPVTFITVPGISRSGQVVAVDPEGLALTYTIIASPTQGSLDLTTGAFATTGVFSYSAVINPAATDSFTVRVSDGAKASTQVFSVVISLIGQLQPTITSPAPMVIYGADTLLYTPTVAVPTVSAVPPVWVASTLTFELQGSLPGAAFNPTNGSINWPSPASPGFTGYYQAAILVIDQANGRAFYQPLLFLWVAGGGPG